jgi:hypothetical protein
LLACWFIVSLLLSEDSSGSYSSYRLQQQLGLFLSTVILKFLGVSSTLLCRGLIKSQQAGAAARFETVIGFSFVFISFERRFGRCGKELQSRCSSNVL